MSKIYCEDAVTLAQLCAELLRQGIVFTVRDAGDGNESRFTIRLEGF